MTRTAAPKSEILKRFYYDPEAGKIFWSNGPRANLEAFTYTQKRGYKATTFRHSGGSTTLTAHRVAWLLHYGDWPTGLIDHINGDKTDNRIVNLRDVMHVDNARNMVLGGGNKSGVVGVFKVKGFDKWQAQIRAWGKTVNIGCFDDFGDAVIARKAAEKVLGYHPNHGSQLHSAGANDG